MVKRTQVFTDSIGYRIVLIRGQKVIIDADLAALYGVPTKAFNQAIKRNRSRFPSDFMFQLTMREKSEVVTNCDHLRRLKFSRTRPYAFTEHGAIQAANALNSKRAVEMSIYVVRAFVRVREVVAAHKELTVKLDRLERTTAMLDLKHEVFADSARANFKQIFDAIRRLLAPPPEPKRRPIGFVIPKDS
jgi:hypothetical protein